MSLAVMPRATSPGSKPRSSEATRATMGDDYWPYGIAANRAELDAVCRYSVEQYLAERRVTVDELFHPSVMDT